MALSESAASSLGSERDSPFEGGAGGCPWGKRRVSATRTSPAAGLEMHVQQQLDRSTHCAEVHGDVEVAVDTVEDLQSVGPAVPIGLDLGRHSRPYARENRTNSSREMCPASCLVHAGRGMEPGSNFCFIAPDE